MQKYTAVLLCGVLVSSSVQAQLGRRGGGQRLNMQNRSANGRGANAGHNNNTNLNRNVNVNQNVNVNRNVNVNVHDDHHDHNDHDHHDHDDHHGGCYNCGYYHDNDWNWGSFAAGAAVGVATTAVVASAAHHSTQTVVVAAPAVGTIIATLPAQCSSLTTGSGVIYSCSNVYYRPYYQGTSLVYQVVTYP